MEQQIKVTREQIRERNKQIKALFTQGKSIIEIGEFFGITKQRTSQILQSMGISPQERRTERKENKELEKQKELSAKYLKRARHLRKILDKEYLRNLSLQAKINMKDKKIEKIANFATEMKSMQMRIAGLSSQLVQKDKKIKELQKQLSKKK